MKVLFSSDLAFTKPILAEISGSRPSTGVWYTRQRGRRWLGFTLHLQGRGTQGPRDWNTPSWPPQTESMCEATSFTPERRLKPEEQDLN
ncbi:hypothetical protein ILYODFUR_020627 [Ilyodon furcidens]|uniref:Uncharacterized protein n=1 Tax=Ilyodon furcidens TaxID=33524 RepID=A0ABV0UK07_9TELE